MLNWRELGESLDPYVQGRGGVIHVRAGKYAPVEIFIDALIHTWLPKSGLTDAPAVCLVDSGDLLTHQPIDLAQELAKCASIDLPARTPPPPVTIASGLRARDVILTNVAVENSVHDPVWERICIETLCAELQVQLRTRRVVLVFPDAHSLEPAHRRKLGHTLWRNRLEKLVQEGLLLVTAYDPSLMAPDDVGFPPAPNHVINLADSFHMVSEEPHALKDLAAAALELGWFEQHGEAHGFAVGLLTTGDTIASVHARLALFQARIGRV